SVDNANNITLILAAATSFVNFQDISADPGQRCEAILSKVRGKNYDTLVQRHVDDFSALFNRVKIDLGKQEDMMFSTDERIRRINSKDSIAALNADPTLAELYFQFGRYMLISSSRLGSQPANLQGVWNGLLDPPWESKMTTNINLEMNYWP